MKKTILLLTALFGSIMPALAGGILTNTNQSIWFLKNPARNATFGLDGVYSNPAGVAFLSDGFHIAFNWQYAHQTRTITSTNPVYALGRSNNGSDRKTFEGVADVPILPSIQAAYNHDSWSFQLNVSVPGGGGACEFDDGLGSFESVVGNIATMLQPFGVQGYDMEGYMKGRQVYYGVQIGAAYKVTPDLAVYGGLRMLIGSATYKATIRNIQVNSGMGYIDFADYLPNLETTINNSLEQVNNGIAAYEAAGATPPDALLEQQAQLNVAKNSLTQLQKYAQGVNLLCNQSGMGIAPIVGIDYRIGDFNFAAKYEFKTEIQMKNESTVFEASEIAAVNKYRDGEKVDEDSPALLSLGVQWNIIKPVTISIGWHHYFDKDAHWYNNTQRLLSHNTNEFLAGVEWDITDRLNISCGGQLTRYGLTDNYMNDLSFIVNSYSIGMGISYKVRDNITLSAAYFQTNYDDYKRNDYPTVGISDSFTRTNHVMGIGCQIDL